MKYARPLGRGLRTGPSFLSRVGLTNLCFPFLFQGFVLESPNPFLYSRWPLWILLCWRELAPRRRTTAPRPGNSLGALCRIILFLRGKVERKDFHPQWTLLAAYRNWLALVLFLDYKAHLNEWIPHNLRTALISYILNGVPIHKRLASRPVRFWFPKSALSFLCW